ncbi:hypothetical protein [Yinghuangia seranimata]|uniref:hypothetical protein n=1 Tax=Yinghuangia seranimata TaxID=408067 RepID=UPI00248B71CC|nr:hypothetical protein [Yinghuangia seranimata]MDI2131937.1 hypothetical protein [Yinghuangia seranimata]
MDDANAPVTWVDPQVDGLERELAAAEAALLDAEVDVISLRVELDNLAIEHHRRLGPLYERLDELEALVAEAQAARSGDAEDIRRAVAARARVDPMPDLDDLMDALSGDGTGPGIPEPPAEEPRRVKPSEEARRLYRELARRAHPDLAQDADEKERRGEFIARVNAAYAAGDIAALMELDAQWASGDGAPPPEQRDFDRVGWLRSRLTLLTERREQLVTEWNALLESPMGQLLALAPDGDAVALLEHLGDSLLERIEAEEVRLQTLLP